MAVGKASRDGLMTGHGDGHASKPAREGECVVTAGGVYGPIDAVLTLEPSWWADP